MTENKGLIKNRKRIKQVIDFTGIQNGKLHPSDIDAVLEFDNEALILIEVKHKFNKIPIGQRLLLERICDSWHTDKSAVLKVEHDFDNDKDILLDKCRVSGIYYNKEWTYYKDTKDFKKFVNKMGEKWNCKKCKF